VVALGTGSNEVPSSSSTDCQRTPFALGEAECAHRGENGGLTWLRRP
jgi:hypothetical protein